MKQFAEYLFLAALSMATGSLPSGCVQLDESIDMSQPEMQKMEYSITVMRDGEVIAREQYGVMTRGEPAADFDTYSTMDPEKGFGIIGIDAETGDLLLNNHQVAHKSGMFTNWVDAGTWGSARTVSLSAYYPYQTDVVYMTSEDAYTIPLSTEETEAGPMVSKTMQRAINDLNRIPIEFQHITNDIGYRICDVTPDPNLQGLIHLRKVIAHNVASAGTYINDLRLPYGSWHKVGYYRDVVIFEGDAIVGVGSENELFIGYDTLTRHLADSHRYYSIPDEILLGKQYVEVVYDVDSFTIEDFTYSPIKGHVTKYALYGLLPDNIFENGKQYTFHLGLDLTTVYQEVAFSASVSDWETKIYENNDVF